MIQFLFCLFYFFIVSVRNVISSFFRGMTKEAAIVWADERSGFTKVGGKGEVCKNSILWLVFRGEFFSRYLAAIKASSLSPPAFVAS